MYGAVLGEGYRCFIDSVAALESRHDGTKAGLGPATLSPAVAGSNPATLRFKLLEGPVTPPSVFFKVTMDGPQVCNLFGANPKQKIAGRRQRFLWIAWLKTLVETPYSFARS